MSRTNSDFGTPGHGKVYRGSRKRVQRIRWQEHTPVELWILLVVLLLVLLIVIPWMIRHPLVD